MENHLVGLNDTWVDAVPSDVTGCVPRTWLTPYVPYVQPAQWAYPLYITQARPITLTMAEVQRLQKAAKDDPKLKETLRKFTPLIEVTVEF